MEWCLDIHCLLSGFLGAKLRIISETSTIFRIIFLYTLDMTDDFNAQIVNVTPAALKAGAQSWSLYTPKVEGLSVSGKRLE